MDDLTSTDTEILFIVLCHLTFRRRGSRCDSKQVNTWLDWVLPDWWNLRWPAIRATFRPASTLRWWGFRRRASFRAKLFRPPELSLRAKLSGRRRDERDRPVLKQIINITSVWEKYSFTLRMNIRGFCWTLVWSPDRLTYSSMLFLHQSHN